MGYEEEYTIEEEEAFEETGGGEIGGGRELWTILWEGSVRWASGMLTEWIECMNGIALNGLK